MTFTTPTLSSLFPQEPSPKPLLGARHDSLPTLTMLDFADPANHKSWDMFYEGRIRSNTTISLMKIHDNKNGQQERTTTSRQQRRQGKDNGGKVGCVLRWIGEGDLCLFSIKGGGSIFNKKISLMTMHDNKNGQWERTTTSRQQWQRVKYNGGKVGSLLRWIGEGGLCLFSIKGESIFNTTISLMTMHDKKNRQRERTTTSRQQRRRVKDNGSEVGRLMRWIGEGDSCLFLIEGGSILNTTINQPDDDAWQRENGQQEQTTTSQQQLRQGKFNGVEVGCLLWWIGEDDLCLFSIKWGVNI